MKAQTIEIDPVAGARLAWHDLRLPGLQAAVGGWIELVRVAPFPDLRLVIDEAGKLRGKLANREATVIADIQPSDYIVGLAIVARLTEDSELAATGADELAAINAVLSETPEGERWQGNWT